jgi:fatty acid desaturase
MNEGWPRPGAQTEYRRREEPRPMRRPDRIALWAVGIAIVGMIAAAASAHASAGGGPTNHFTHTDAIRAAPIKK